MKPAGQVFSLLSILGRVLLIPEIFPVLEKTAPGAGSEIQLTDAMCALGKRLQHARLRIPGHALRPRLEAGLLSQP
ncbi:MAG: hypothetical protein ACLUFV_02900 [Acutalibacteraceae bacterium]